MEQNAPYDRDALTRTERQPIPPGTKGWPAEATGMPASDVGRPGWRVLDGDLPFPVLVLRETALAHNLDLMRSFCERAGVLLAPHGKTTMAPQLFARQLDAGVWGLTAATPVHLRVYRELGMRRILLANQLVEPLTIRWVAGELSADPEFEFICLVDSLDGVALLDRELDAAASDRPVSVLVEMGMAGARAGCRSSAEAVEVGRAVARSTRLRLAGVEGFEGLASDLDQVDAFLAEIERTGAAFEREQLVEGSDWLVSAGGSAYFDRVVERFSGRRVILRSGCYLTHDDGVYARDSPLAGRAGDGSPRLANAIEIWSAVLSRPEPGLVVTSMGKRDAAFDLDLPTPALTCALGAERPRALTGEVLQLSDQHAHIRVDPAESVRVGDLVGCTISHPCTALDKWRVIPTIDDDYRVVGALHTFF